MGETSRRDDGTTEPPEPKQDSITKRKKRNAPIDIQKMRDSFVEKHSVPLENLVNGIDLSGLRLDPIFKVYESHEYDNIDSWNKREGEAASTEYNDLLLRDIRNPIGAEQLRKFMEIMRGTILIDLGARDCDGYFLAKEFGARGYIGVDKFHCKNPNILNQEDGQLWGSRELKNKSDIPYTVVQEDMLDFLKRLPDNSVSILTTGVEVGIEGKFARLVEKEIERVLDPKGAYITFFSKFEPKGLKRTKFQGETSANRHGGLWQFTK